MNKKYLDKSGLERVSGTINKKLTKNNNMPAASASLLGKFCLYTGENSATFRKGGVYECIHTSSGYKWELRSFNFIGTTSEWNALELEEKVAYQTADILDDDNKTRYAVNQITGALIPISGGEVSWTGTLSEWSALSLEERAKYDGKKVFITDDYMENIPVMIGASAGEDGFKGLVPTPHAGDENKVLKGNGSWGEAAADDNFVGTLAQWNALSAADKVKYKTADITDDFNGAPIDSALSATSTNPVQNKVVKAAIDDISTVEVTTIERNTDYTSSGTITKKVINNVVTVTMYDLKVTDDGVSTQSDRKTLFNIGESWTNDYFQIGAYANLSGNNIGSFVVNRNGDVYFFSNENWTSSKYIEVAFTIVV